MLGAGNIGAILARKWTGAGHAVALASRDPDGIRGLASEMGARRLHHVDACVAQRSCSRPFRATQWKQWSAPSARTHGKVVIDATNDLSGGELNSIRVIGEAAPGATCV